MKFIKITSITVFVLLLQSCKKEIYGCTDTTAANYSTLANKDDGSCFHVEPSAKSTIVTISNWTSTVDSWVTTIPYGEITSEVVENGAVISYVQTGTNLWTALPLTIYNSTSYSTTIEVTVTVGQVLIEYKNSDASMPAQPLETVFKISAIS